MNNNLQRWQNPGAIALIILTVLLMYWQVTGFNYVWDDQTVFLDRFNLLNGPLTWAALTEPVLPESSYFRPLIFFTLWAEFHLFGQNPFVSHAINLAILLINCLLIYGIGRLLALRLKRPAVTLIGLLPALIYAVHPALVEATAWVSGRFDMLATLFLLAGTFIFLTKLSPLPKNLLVALCMLLALASKEIGIALPAILFCVWVATAASPADETPLQTFWRGLAGNKHLWLTLIIALAVYMLLRLMAMPNTFHGTFTFNYIRSAWFENLLPLDAWRFYLLQTFLPFHEVSVQHPYKEFIGGSQWWRWLSNLLALVLLIALVVRAWSKRTPATWLGIAGLICLIPVLHFIPLPIDINIGHERFLTAPLAFWALAIVLVRYDQIFAAGVARKWLNPQRLPLLKGLVGGTLLVWTLVAIATTLSILPMWQSDLALWSWSLQKHPDLVPSRYNYWLGAVEAGREDLAEKEAQRAAKESETTGIDIGLQVVYASYLVTHYQPDGLLYAKGIELAIPKFYEEFASVKDLRASPQSAGPLGTMQISDVYSILASGTFLFEGKLAEALAYNKLAQWYYGVPSAALLYQQQIFLEMEGKFAAAQAAERQADQLYFPQRAAVKNRGQTMLAYFCAAQQMSGACPELVKQGRISSELVAEVGRQINEMKAAAKEKAQAQENDKAGIR